MALVSRIVDGMQSLVTRLGTSQDKAATSTYFLRVLRDDQLEAAYRNSWVARKMVTIPALDATRKWRKWTGPLAKAILDFEDSYRIRLKERVYEAYSKARLYGGAAILIGTNDADWSRPLVPSEVRRNGIRYLAVLTRHDLMAGLLEDDPREERFGKPRYYDIATTSAQNGGVFRIHPSRLVEFRGNALPRWDANGDDSHGWGDSVLQAAYEACRNLDATMANIASLVFEAKTDIVRIPDLSANITDPQYEEALLRRFSTARMLKGNHGTLILDKEEEYDSKSFTFGGLDSISDRFMQVASGAADIPITRFLGTSPSGLQSTGQHDLLNYYDMVSSLQVSEIEPALAPLDEMIVRSLGGNYDDHTYEWLPLHQMTDKDLSDIRHNDARSVKHLFDTGLFARESLAELASKMFDGVAPLKYDPNGRPNNGGDEGQGGRFRAPESGEDDSPSLERP